MAIDYIYGEKRREFLCLQAENKKLTKALQTIQAISCGEKQIADNDSDGMGVIYNISTKALT